MSAVFAQSSVELGSRQSIPVTFESDVVTDPFDWVAFCLVGAALYDWVPATLTYFQFAGPTRTIQVPLPTTAGNYEIRAYQNLAPSYPLLASQVVAVTAPPLLSTPNDRVRVGASSVPVTVRGALAGDSVTVSVAGSGAGFVTQTLLPGSPPVSPITVNVAVPKQGDFEIRHYRAGLVLASSIPFTVLPPVEKLFCDLTVRADLTQSVTAAFAAPVWVDLTPYVTKLRVSTGRRDSTVSYPAGEIEVTLSDPQTMQWHPMNSRSTRFAAIRPSGLRRRVQVLFRGTVIAEAWSKSWTPSASGDETVMRAYDAMSLLSDSDAPALSTLTGSQLPQARLDSIIARVPAAGFPAGMLDHSHLSINGGSPFFTEFNPVITLQTSDLRGDLLTQAKLGIDSIGGYLYVNPRTGQLTAKKMTWRLSTPRPGLALTANPRSLTNQWTFSDQPTGNTQTLAKFRAVDPERRQSLVFNRLTIAHKGGTEFEYTSGGLSAVAGAGPGRRDYEFNAVGGGVGTPSSTAQGIGRKLVADSQRNYGMPWDQVEVNVAVQSSSPAAVVALQLHDQVTLTNRIPNAARLGIPANVSVDPTFIEGIDHDIDMSGRWTMTVFVSASAGDTFGNIP